MKDDPLWYKDAIIYELHVKAFYDSNGDGIGDFPGLTEKLDYLEDLGITAVWLLPFYPSPLKDDGYDISDYFNIHSDYGTLKDFKNFLKEAHKRGIKVITELVLNHTSSEHIWFQRARKAKPGSKFRDFYVWSDTPDKYKDARIIFKDFETSNWRWDPVAGAYYWHRFYSHQPDLNYDNPDVQEAILGVIDFWFSLGVDGMRLDAIPYLYQREGTNCENLPETHAFLKRIRAYVDNKFKNKMLLAEANQWPEDAAAYFGSGDESHMAFHFPLMPRLFAAIHMEDSFPIIDILRSTPDIPESCQWAIFLRNHDELTLEMVTDEERDYMYKIYARDPRARINLGIRRRLSPLLSGNRRKIELMNILLFSLPGTPVIYNGDEIGMGDNYYLGDRNGVRTPMQWSPDRNAGFSTANPHQLYLPVIIDPEYHYEANNVENQQKNLSSLLWWMKRVIAMRKRFKAFSRGSFKILTVSNPRVFVFVRQYQDENILGVVNLSRFSQFVEIDLSEYRGYILKEVFSQNEFPPVREGDYALTLGPHNHFWLLMTPSVPISIAEVDKKEVSVFEIEGSWESIFEGKDKGKFEAEVLSNFLRSCRWFREKAKAIRRVKIVENCLVDKSHPCFRLLIIEVSYTEGLPSLYLLPLAFSMLPKAQKILEEAGHAVICRLHIGNEVGIIYDASYDEEFQKKLLALMSTSKKIKGRYGDFVFYRGKNFKKLLKGDTLPLSSRLVKVEQSNTSFFYGDKFFLKLYRRLDEGRNPELEILQILTEKTRFSNIPAFAGFIDYKTQQSKETMTVALLQEFITNVGDAWTFSQNELREYFEKVLSRKELDISKCKCPEVMEELIGGLYLEMVSLLGIRTAEFHLAMSSISDEEGFSPEPFSILYQRSFYQSIKILVNKNIQLLRKKANEIPEFIKASAELIISSENEILRWVQMALSKKLSTEKIRIHGDFHLGQVLFTGKDFVIMDFEGEPQRALSERKLKYSPFKDVAGMIRSFHYAAFAAIFLSSTFREEDTDRLKLWIEPWYQYVSEVYLKSYLKTVKDSSFVPKQKEEMKTLLNIFLLDKAIYELGYELNNRPDWIVIPIKGIESIIKEIL